METVTLPRARGMAVRDRTRQGAAARPRPRHAARDRRQCDCSAALRVRVGVRVPTAGSDRLPVLRRQRCGAGLAAAQLCTLSARRRHTANSVFGRQRHLHHSAPGVVETPAGSTLVGYFCFWHSINICFQPCIRVSRIPPEGRFHACNPVQGGFF